MSIKVHLYSSLQTYTGGQVAVDVQGSTVGDCLRDLVRLFPRLKTQIFAEDGQIRSTVFVSINLDSPYAEKQEKPVAQTDELYIVLIIVGG